MPAAKSAIHAPDTIIDNPSNVVAMPSNVVVTQQMMNEWYETQKQLEALKQKEMELRKKIFGYYFKHPEEGVNTAPLSHGWVLKGTQPINRKVLPEILQAKQAEMRKHGIPLDTLVKWKPEISVSEYKKLSPEHRKEFDSVLEIKPGSPALEIVLPKR